MQTIYAFNNSESIDLKLPQKQLLLSMQDMYNLYLLLVSLLIEVHSKAEDHLNKSKLKHLATLQEKNPNKKFVDNILLQELKHNKAFQEVLKKRKPNDWKLDSEYVEIVFKKILDSEIYLTYMQSQNSSFNEDKKFVLDVFKIIIAPDEKLYDYIEDKKLTWLDDLPVVNTGIVKLLKKTKRNANESYYLPALYRDEEDKDFAIELLQKTILNQNEYNKEIASRTTNWDSDRLAVLDSILLKMAICELQNFPSIPTKVTMNEYLEIAKEYSTPKSSVFINGILDKIVKEYSDKGKLNKTGRGLM
ncbi:MAG: transcription antitermination factor NusB [Flavobacteriaceae bacterium]|nr:transcription antitermination factor NusB [Bacteroidia bacterium]NNL15169.1 transcription antitermination factor NusB [Flavobacteriaceae bacterium]